MKDHKLKLYGMHGSLLHCLHCGWKYQEVSGSNLEEWYTRLVESHERYQIRKSFAL